mmetsp:Transcript_12852/g.22933  ORF Transcript_12852/g.22933 Transcript_12852/m.22933 type:complete len:267 (-) Transcript_12852:378-1178(-)
MGGAGASHQTVDAPRREMLRDGSTLVAVTQPAGFLLKVELVAKVELSPRQIFDILVDPDNERVFRSIKGRTSRRVIKTEGHKRTVEVVQVSHWQLLMFRGLINTHLIVEEDPKACTLNFRLAKRGVMRDFEGSWKLEPYSNRAYQTAMHRVGGGAQSTERHPNAPWAAVQGVMANGLRSALSMPHPFHPHPHATVVSLTQSVAPAHAPPPLDRLLRGISIRTVQSVVDDLQAEAARMRREEAAAKSVYASAADILRRRFGRWEETQ